MTITTGQAGRRLPEVDAWKVHDPEDPLLDPLRDYLAEHNGIHQLEVLSKDQIADAVRVFRRDGFVVIADVLTSEQLASIKAGVDAACDDILAIDPDRKGNRMPGRYSFGGCSSTKSMLHREAWQQMLEIEFVHEIVEAIFENDNYWLRAASGDFCVPGAAGYQPLHADMGNFNPAKPSPFAAFQDHRGSLDFRDLPNPYIAVNFLMVDATPINGPTRQIPGTHNRKVPMPTLEEEPEWMRMSTVCPASAGSIQIRDVRAWHGGTPNVSDHLRAIPNLEFYAPWFREPMWTGIDRADWEGLSDRARAVTRHAVADSAERIDPTVALNSFY